MKIPFSSMSQTIQVEPFRTYQEKDLLLVPSYTDIEDDSVLDIALDILKVPSKVLEQLSLDEKKALIYKFREVSVGETLEIKYKCQHCGTPGSSEVSISGIIHTPKKHSDKVRDLHRLPVDEVDLRHNFLTDTDLDYEWYEDLLLNIKDYLTYYDFTVHPKCFACKKECTLSIKSNKFIFEMISDDSITSLYKNYHTLIYYGKWSKNDIDNLYPFERQIFIQLLNKTIEENNKKIRR